MNDEKIWEPFLPLAIKYQNPNCPFFKDEQLLYLTTLRKEEYDYGDIELSPEEYDIQYERYIDNSYYAKTSFVRHSRVNSPNTVYTTTNCKGGVVISVDKMKELWNNYIDNNDNSIKLSLMWHFNFEDESKSIYTNDKYYVYNQQTNMVYSLEDEDTSKYKVVLHQINKNDNRKLSKQINELFVKFYHESKSPNGDRYFKSKAELSEFITNSEKEIKERNNKIAELQKQIQTLQNELSKLK